MKKISALLMALLAVTACTTAVRYEIDPEATAKAKFKVGQLIKSDDFYIYEIILSVKKRYFVGLAKNGDYVVRD